MRAEIVMFDYRDGIDRGWCVTVNLTDRDEGSCARSGDRAENLGEAEAILAKATDAVRDYMRHGLLFSEAVGTSGWSIWPAIQ